MHHALIWAFFKNMLITDKVKIFILEKIEIILCFCLEALYCNKKIANLFIFQAV